MVQIPEIWVSSRDVVWSTSPRPIAKLGGVGISAKTFQCSSQWVNDIGEKEFDLHLPVVHPFIHSVACGKMWISLNVDKVEIPSYLER